MTGTENATMAKKAGRPKKPGGVGTQVRIDTTLASKAKYVASSQGLNLVDYLSEILRPTIERDFRKAAPVDDSEN